MSANLMKIGEQSHMPQIIPLFRPSMGEEEIQAVAEVLRSGWIGLGPRTEQLEQEFAKYIGCRYAVAMNSATAALHLALVGLGIGDGDEVLVPSLTFVSTVHAILYCRATPVFVDVDLLTLNFDARDANTKITAKSKALISVHYGGRICSVPEINELARQHGLLWIEDAAHACGSSFRGTKAGNFGDAGCFSFHAVKNLACGDGGMAVTNRQELDLAMRRLRWLGIDADTWKRSRSYEAAVRAGIETAPAYGWHYEIHELGFKCHMNDIAAAIALVQLKKLESANARRREIAAWYDEALAPLDWLALPPRSGEGISASHNYVIQTAHRDLLNLHLKAAGISSGVHYLPIHLQPYYRQRFPACLPVTERIWPRLLTLPLFPDMSGTEFERIIEAVRTFRPPTTTLHRQ